jgi:ubiquinone/menaquinone biosynthesis C-methylase UbiE
MQKLHEVLLVEGIDEQATRRAEQEHFDALYRTTGPIRADDRRSFREVITPAHLPGGATRGLIHLRAYELLDALDVRSKRVLDYACGAGHWAVHLASLGAHVSAFDLSPVGVERGRRRAVASAVRVDFRRADAADLPFATASFDIVLGIDALHHTVKYPGTNDELFRVLKPGGVAIFTENLGHNPLLQLARRVTMRGNDAGDVILTERLVRTWASRFSETRIEPYGLLMMAKRIERARPLLPLLHRADEVVLSVFPTLRRYCGECVIVLCK